MLVSSVEARPVRSLADLRVGLDPGITSILGLNGTGKTNLLEALYFALTGRSFRTSDRRELIPFGESLARAEATVEVPGDRAHVLLAAISRTEGRRHLLDGEPLRGPGATGRRPRIAVFSPDRLALVKGPPAQRRAHIDGFIAARWPTRVELRQRFGQALAQRNAMLSRVAAGHVGADSLETWDHTLADAAMPLIEARADAAADLAGPFATAAADLGLGGNVVLEYRPRADVQDAAELRAGLAERRDADLRLGRTSWGPQLDEITLQRDGRALRRYGSQGEQRTALLALLFAERESLEVANETPPLLLLDDVMSELDPERRTHLVARLGASGQTLITAADEAALPDAARERVVEMPSGRARGLARVA